jgi:hypothetical protein
VTEWNAGGYYRQSALQKWVADEHLASLTLADGERVLNVGCGDGKKVPKAERDRFIGDVLDAYAQVGDDAGPSIFVFYQMEVELRRP